MAHHSRHAFAPLSRSFGSSRLMAMFGTPDDVEERLWREMETRMEEVVLEEEPVYLIGFGPAELKQMRRLMERLGMGPAISFGDIFRLTEIAEMVHNSASVIINIDAFDDVDGAVTTLMSFRKLNGQISVLLVSENVLGDDFSSEREAICDTTLRSPLTLDRLEKGLITTRRRRLEPKNSPTLTEFGQSPLKTIVATQST